MTEKLALCSIVSNDHIEYLRIFCLSILEFTPNFDRDYLIYYRKGNLNQNDINYLQKIYSKFIFKEITIENNNLIFNKKYNNVPTTGYKKGDIPRHKLLKKFSLSKIEMFKESEYDQIIYFDIDMVCIKDLSPLLSKRFNEGLMACEDELPKLYNLVDSKTYERDHKVQGGLLILGKDIINRKTYDELKELLINKKFKRNDQSIFGQYFGKQNKLKRLDIKFNCGRKLIRDNFIKIEDVFIIHYAGAKKPFDILKNKKNYDCFTFKYWHKFKDLSDNNSLLISNMKFYLNFKIYPCIKKLLQIIISIRCYKVLYLSLQSKKKD